MTQRILQMPELDGRKGRFGNQMMWYALGRWICETYDATLQTPPWDGDRIFAIDDPPHDNIFDRKPLSWPLAPDMKPWEGCAILDSDQYSFIPQYTDADFRRYMPFREDFSKPSNYHEHVAHLRRGDFLTNKPHMWPFVDEEEIRRAGKAQGYDYLEMICEERPHIHCGHPYKLSWLEDFLLMVTAPALFVYPSSTFSGCAAKFNRGKVYIPMDYTNGPTKCKWVLREEMPDIPPPSTPITLQ